MPPSQRGGFNNLTGEYMNRTGMRIVNVLGQDYSPDAASLMLRQPQIDAIFWYDYYSYSALGGNVTFFGGKPVIGGRYQLWTGVFDDPASLTAKLLAMPKDPSSPLGYSLIPVHVWTNNVTDVKTVADALAAAGGGGIDVVTPDEFVRRIVTNLQPAR